MRIAVRLDRSRLFRWQLTLITALREAGHAVAVDFRMLADPLPISLIAVLDFDAARSNSGDDRLSARLAQSAFAELPPEEGDDPARDGERDLTIDLATSLSIERIGGRVLRPLYDASATDEALFRALLAGRAPRLTVYDTEEDSPWSIGLPAIEQPTLFTGALDNVASRLVEGLAVIVARIAAGGHPPEMARARRDKTRRTMLAAVSRYGVRLVGAKLGRARDRAFGNVPRWRVAWRPVGEGAQPKSATLDLADFHVLDDDGRRFYADPVLVVRDGAIHVFVEELPDDTGIGHIAHFTIGADGKATNPAPVLKTPTHLSYPFVFEHDGETWMMPESVAAGSLDLYRCRRFPDVWEHEARLLEGRFHDATLFTHEGRVWIAAATEAWQSSTWDALSLFHASALTGPWTPHAMNPVIVDARWARPAGPQWRDGTGLIRPAQDCNGGYGGALTLRRILRLTPDEFAEETVGSLAFAGAGRILGPHTIGRAGGIEIIDLYARSSDLHRRRR
jgi:hypothetical protein